MKIQFVVFAVKWFDRVNGNTYHSARIIRTIDGATICCSFQYGYGEQYRHTALGAMVEAGWIPEKYEDNRYSYEMENDYPILWFVTNGTKKECMLNGA